MRITHPIIIVIAMLIFAGCQGEDNPPVRADSVPSVEVKTQKIIAQTGHLQTEVVGTVQAVKRAVIAAKVTGTISEMPVSLGSTVKKGSLLVAISAEEISAKAVQARAQLEQTKRNLEREKKLLAKNAATSESVKSLEEMYTIAEAAHREAATMLSYTKITAPFDGVITIKKGNEGDLATPGTPLLHLEDNSKLQVVASIPETLVLQIHRGDTLAVRIPVVGAETPGTVAEVSPAADPLTRTALVKLNIDSGSDLRSGQFARVYIPSERKESLFIPNSAIQRFGQMEQIYVVKDNKVHLRLIRTGAIIDPRLKP